MKEWVYDCWISVMDARINPLRHIPNVHARHLILQILAWMWCVSFSIYLGSFLAFGISGMFHVIILGAIAVTVATFETAGRSPNTLMNITKRIDGYNGRQLNGEHN